jgi:hypothetical protein
MRMNDATPEQAEAALRTYCEKLAPDAIIDSEFDTRLGNADLIAHLIGQEVEMSADPEMAHFYPNGPVTLEQARANWEAKSDIEKRMEQVSFVAPPHCYF